jgi:NCS1 family nucleobase:cation symporter-1
MLGQILGLPTTMLGFCAIGVFVTSASKQIMPEVDIAELWDPVFILSQITSSQPPKGLDQPLVSSPFLRFIIAVTSLFGIAVSCVSVNIAGNVVSSANDFGNLAPKYISFKTGGLITGLIGILIMPWKLMDSADVYIFEWLVGYSALMGPIAGIMIVDYWLIRETDLMIDDLYRYDGRYPRFQLSSIISLVLSVAPNVPGFIRSASGISTKSNFFDIIYSYAWFIGFFLAGCLHYVMATTKLNY